MKSRLNWNNILKLSENMLDQIKNTNPKEILGEEKFDMIVFNAKCVEAEAEEYSQSLSKDVRLFTTLLITF